MLRSDHSHLGYLTLNLDYRVYYLLQLGAVANINPLLAGRTVHEAKMYSRRHPLGF